MDMKSFNGDCFLREEFRHLIQKYDVHTVIETGTYYGETTADLATMVDNVITIESSDTYFSLASARLAHLKNVTCYFGSSPDVIRDEWINIQKLNKPNYMFFLDAHWTPPTPTPNELKMIHSHGLKPVIIIHDFKNPNHPEYGWDYYKDFEYTYAAIATLLDNIYGKDGYEYYFNDLAAGAKRGVIFIAPKGK